MTCLHSKGSRVWCGCETCRAFGKDPYYHWPKDYDKKTGLAIQDWFNPNGPCELCYEDRGEHVAFVPEVFREFLTGKVCQWCRNSVCCHVNKEWGLCWADSPDWALKWAMTEWVLSHMNNHIYHSDNSIRFQPRLCCAAGHARAA